MLHELFITHCTNGTLIMNPFTLIKDSYNHDTLLEARKLKKLDIQLANLLYLLKYPRQVGNQPLQEGTNT